MKKTTPSLPVPGGIPKSISMSPDAIGAFRDVLNARKELAIVKEQESTKRDAIMARMKTRLEDIATRRDAVTLALEKEFGIRQKAIDDLFTRLDLALEQGKDEFAIAVVTSIEGIVKTSPIGSALRVLADNFERDDGVIDI